MSPSTTVVFGLMIGAAVFWRDRREYIKSFREPVLATPVVIFESDDWSPGPPSHAEALDEISAILSEFTDQNGEHPKFAIGVCLAIVDAQIYRESGTYERIEFSHSCARAVARSLKHGVTAGTFTLQLHGREHYWPATLMARARNDEAVRTWLESETLVATEGLPSEIQSRWTDATSLPSSDHPDAVVEEAVCEEFACYEVAFKQRACVYVPPTFLWTAAVEKTLAACGCECIVTPGKRFVGRDESGALISDHEYYWNGRRLEQGLVSLVRDIYYEPALGHKVADTIARILHQVDLGRPALLETHRFNFLENQQQRCKSLTELKQLLTLITEQLPTVAYPATQQLSDAYRNPTQAALTFERSFTRRARVVWRRLWSQKRVRKNLSAGVAAILLSSCLTIVL